jgi:hypothetical protein
MINAAGLAFGWELLKGGSVSADSDTATASATDDRKSGAGAAHVEFMDPNRVLEFFERKGHAPNWSASASTPGESDAGAMTP